MQFVNNLGAQAQGHPAVRAMIEDAQQQRLYGSNRTIARHRRRNAVLGHLRCFCRLGNKGSVVLRGMDSYMLAYWRLVWPKSTHAELNALLFQSQLARGVANPRFFSPSQISRAEDRLGISKKRGSTSAYQALLPRNLAKRWVYWNCPYPAGIADIPKDDWIDIDECALFVDTMNRKYGKCYIGGRVREEGP